MAKLYARNRTELLRMEKDGKIHDDFRDRAEWSRHEIAFMSDGNTLTKYTVKYFPSAYDPKGRVHSFGWKKKGKYTLSIEETKKRYIESGWKEVK